MTDQESPSPCDVHRASSRLCEYGTAGCVVHHPGPYGQAVTWTTGQPLAAPQQAQKENL